MQELELNYSYLDSVVVGSRLWGGHRRLTEETKLAAKMLYWYIFISEKIPLNLSRFLRYGEWF